MCAFDNMPNAHNTTAAGEPPQLAGNQQDGNHRDGGDPLHNVAVYVQALSEAAREYVSARRAAVRLAAMRTLWLIVLGISALVAAVVIMVMGLVYLFDGMAHGIAALFGDRLWVGNLLTGLFWLVALVIGVVIAKKQAAAAALRKRVADDEARRQRREPADPHDAGDVCPEPNDACPPVHEGIRHGPAAQPPETA